MKRLARLLQAIHGWMVRREWDWASAVLLALLTVRLGPRGPYRVLCLNKAVFNLDVAALANQSKSVAYLIFPRLFLADYVKRRVPRFDELDDASYHVIMNGTREQEQLLADMTRLLRRLRWLLRIDAVLCGNFVYVTQQELQRASLAMGMPVLVLYKEGMWPVGRYEDVGPKVYATKKCHATRVMFYNQNVRDMLVRAQVAGLEESNAVVVGIPRFDDYQLRASQPVRRHITLFFFNPERQAAYLATGGVSREQLIERGIDFQRALVHYAARHPDVSLTIKAKGNHSSRAALSDLLSACQIDGLPDNIRVTHSGEARDLIERSWAVAGFTSTTLLEAVYLGAPVVCPDFRDLTGSKPVDYFHEEADQINYVQDAKHLSAVLDRGDLRLPDEAGRIRILEPLVYKLDGKASQRVEHVLREVIASSGTAPD